MKCKIQPDWYHDDDGKWIHVVNVNGNIYVNGNLTYRKPQDDWRYNSLTEIAVVGDYHKPDGYAPESDVSDAETQRLYESMREASERGYYIADPKRLSESFSILSV